MSQPKKLDYGIDAPGLCLSFLVGGILSGGLLIMTWLFLSQGSVLRIAGVSLFGIAAVYFTFMGCLMLYWSKVHKIRNRHKLLDCISWTGDEKILDVGCGRGLLLIGAAKRLSTGTAIGIDIWEKKDQSGNSPDFTLQNAFIEGVQDKIEVLTADTRALPFADDTFDAVMSHWVVHNLDKHSDRDIALTEMVRVLKPGGTLIVADIDNRTEYIEKLIALKIIDIGIMVSRISDMILNILSFGSFRPSAIIATKHSN